MSKIWLTSDTHFGHDKEFIWGARGFTSVDEMNIEIVKRWNEVVAPDDEVYHLGDVAMGSLENLEWVDNLNGNIHFIRGNHCTDNRAARLGATKYADVLKYGKYRFYLSHYPTLCANWDDNNRGLKGCTWNLCGHTHTTDPFVDMDKGLIYHIEMDAHQCRPCLLDDIIQDVTEYVTIQKD